MARDRNDDIVETEDFQFAPPPDNDGKIVLRSGWQTQAWIKRMKIEKGANLPPVVDLKTLAKIPFAKRLQTETDKKGE